MKRPIIISLLIVALAFVCLGISAVIFFTANGGFPTNNPFDVRNISSEVEESKTFKVDAEKPITLNVASAAGDVTVTGADVDTVQVKVIKTAYDSSQARADDEVKGIKYTIEQTGNTIALNYELPKSMNFNNQINTVDFIVTLPAEVSVDINTGAGGVSVSGTEGDVSIVNSFGDIDLANLAGELNVETGSGGVVAVSVDADGKDISLNSGFGSISLEKASGASITLLSESGTLDLEDVRATRNMDLTSTFGNVNFDRGSAGSLTVSTDSGAVSLTSVNVRGDLVVEDEFGNINLEKVNAESYDIHTNSGSIILDGAQNAVKAYTGFGNISIMNAEDATLDLNTDSGAIDFEGSLGEGPHNLHSEFGEIEVSIPADAALNVDFKTDFGKIISDLPVTMTLSGDLNQAHQAGTINGGGSQFNVSTKSGGITIKVLGG